VCTLMSLVRNFVFLLSPTVLALAAKGFCISQVGVVG
jgi:hypothetical protein